MSIHQSNLEDYLKTVALEIIFPPPDAKVIKSLCQKPTLQLYQKTSNYYNKEADETSKLPDDGRERVKKTKYWPYSVHGLFAFCFKDVPKWGTGILIGPNIVLTAAHNLYDYETKTYANKDTMQFLPAVNGQKLPFHFTEIEEYFVSPSYIVNKKEDFGLLLLKKPIGNKTGYFGLVCLEPKQLKRKVVQIYGYPDEKVKDKPNHYEMWGMKGRVEGTDLNTGEIYHPIKTSSGQDGSGVCLRERENYYVCGVHQAENRATLLTRDVYEQIYKWIKKKADNELLQFNQIKDLNLKNFEINKECVSILINKNLDNLINLDLSSTKIGLAEITELTKAPWTNLSVLNLSQNNIGNEEAGVLVKNTSWKNHSKLNLSKNKISAEGAEFLAQNDSWSDLSELNLSRNNLRDQGAIELAKNTSWTNLSKLKLNDNKISNEGAEAISQNKFWTQLSELNFNINPIGDKGIQAILRNSSWIYLSRLSLNKTGTTQAGARALAQNSSWEYLARLSLSKNDICDEGALELSKNISWGRLSELNLSENRISCKGALELAKNISWKDLSKLNLSGNNISDKGALELAQSTSWTDLSELNLSGNDISDNGALELAKNTSWRNLSKLDLSKNNISDVGALELAKNPSWIKLSKLNVNQNKLTEEGFQSLTEEISKKKVRPLDSKQSHQKLKGDVKGIFGGGFPKWDINQINNEEAQVYEKDISFQNLISFSQQSSNFDHVSENSKTVSYF